jgi:hypothetical protein
MIKFFQIIGLITFWLQAFIAPVLLCGFFAFILYTNNNNVLAIIVLSIGIIGGIILAEFIRRKYGLLEFFSRINGPNEIDDEIESKR